MNFDFNKNYKYYTKLDFRLCDHGSKVFSQENQMKFTQTKKLFFFLLTWTLKNQSEIVEFIEVEDAKLENAYKNSLTTK